MSSSASRKRTRADDAEEANMLIKTAAGEPLRADSLMVRMFSSCARQLPADTAEWDVSGLLYSEQQQPFAQATVKCWLACALTVLNGTDQLDADGKAQLSTAKGLHAVLTFAHAVGSRTSVYTAACSQLDRVKFVVQLADTQTLDVELSRRASYYFTDGVLWFDDAQVAEAAPYSQPGHELGLRRQVAEQTGALLHMAHVLRLQPMLDALHDFVFFNSRYCNNILNGVMELVFTEEVLSTALGTGTISKETYVSSVLTRPCGFVEGKTGVLGLLEPVASSFTSDPETGELKFEARMLRDFAGYTQGESVTATINLFNGGGRGLFIKAGDNEDEFPAQLLLGRAVGDDEDWEELMRHMLRDNP